MLDSNNVDHSGSDQDENTQSRIERINQLAEWLDSSIRIPGTNHHIGWDVIIGLLPGIGDLASTTLSVWIINESRKLGVSKFTLFRMIARTTLDTLIGSIPLVGDVFDAVFKSNTKNLKLLQKSINQQGNKLGDSNSR